MSVGVYVSIVNRKPRIGMTWNSFYTSCHLPNETNYCLL